MLVNEQSKYMLLLFIDYIIFITDWLCVKLLMEIFINFNCFILLLIVF